MQRKWTISLTLVIGVVLGTVGGRILAAPAANAQSSGSSGFHAVAVAATQSGTSSFAWFVGGDGSSRVCSYSNPVHCIPVNY